MWLCSQLGFSLEVRHALTADFATRLTGCRQELGENAYAVFNTLTDIAARPPEIACFQQTCDTIERRSGRWLKDLARQTQSPEFNLERWIPSWEAGKNGNHSFPD